MKISRIILAMLLICIAGDFAFSQKKDESKEDKSKNETASAKTIEVKANLMVLNADGKFADDVKLEDIKIYEDGAEQKITYFAKKQNALNVGFVIDNTGSMKPFLAEITKAVSILAANLYAQDEAFIVRFVNSSKVEIIQDWTSQKSELISTLEDLFVEGGQSAITDALYLSTQKILEREKQDASKRYALVLISDGEERDSYYNTKELLSLLKGKDIQIHMLSYADFSQANSKAAVKFSNQITFETGGIARILSKQRTKEEIIDALKAIVTELRSNFIVGYTSTNQKLDGLPRKLIVQVTDGAKGEKRQAFIRDGFIVPEIKTK